MTAVGGTRKRALNELLLRAATQKGGMTQRLAAVILRQHLLAIVELHALHHSFDCIPTLHFRNDQAAPIAHQEISVDTCDD